MFSNLIESSSHKKEFKRRGSFLLFTTATYVVLFVITGVISIYAYDARLEKQNLEIVILLPPTELVPEPPAQTPPERPQVTRETNDSGITERAEPMVSVNRPDIPPDTIEVRPNTNPPIPDHGIVAITGRNRDASGVPDGPGTPGGQVVVPPRQVVKIEEPPPAPEQPKVPRVISKGPITGQATSLPQPPYPQIAKTAGIQGRVSVQVLIDEKGNVISATPIDGHPTLKGAAQRAALQAKFSPTTLGGLPVRVSGVITYDFKLTR
ncbi:MAG TPA: energy transducer TonB [Pyrinomonadaceae bacterium]|nr:energy transducer TonB [Pyrinomonadaceae bacterium]